MRFRLNWEFGSRFIASVLGAAFLFALALAASPQLHARVHRDSDTASHECAATFIAAGSYEHSAPPVVLFNPQTITQFATLPSFTIPCVKTPFLSASIFEHAPPVVS